VPARAVHRTMDLPVIDMVGEVLLDASPARQIALLQAAVAAALDGFQLWKFLLPVPQHVGFYGTQLAHFTYREVAFSWDSGQFIIVARFQHILLLGL